MKKKPARQRDTAIAAGVQKLLGSNVEAMMNPPNAVQQSMIDSCPRSRRKKERRSAFVSRGVVSVVCMGFLAVPCWVGIAGLRMGAWPLEVCFLGGSLVTAGMIAWQHTKRIERWRREEREG